MASAVNQRRLVSMRTALPLPVHGAQLGAFRRIPASSLASQVGFVQFPFWEHQEPHDLPSAPSAGCEGQGGMLCRQLALFIYHRENAADKQ